MKRFLILFSILGLCISCTEKEESRAPFTSVIYSSVSKDFSSQISGDMFYPLLQTDSIVADFQFNHNFLKSESKDKGLTMEFNVDQRFYYPQGYRAYSERELEIIGSVECLDCKESFGRVGEYLVYDYTGLFFLEATLFTYDYYYLGQYSTVIDNHDNNHYTMVGNLVIYYQDAQVKYICFNSSYLKFEWGCLE